MSPRIGRSASPVLTLINSLFPLYFIGTHFVIRPVVFRRALRSFAVASGFDIAAGRASLKRRPMVGLRYEAYLACERV